MAVAAGNSVGQGLSGCAWMTVDGLQQEGPRIVETVVADTFVSTDGWPITDSTWSKITAACLDLA
jgi:hypothetical protein